MHEFISNLAFSAAGSAVLAGLLLAIPFFRNAIGKFVAGFVQHHFDQRIELLKSELRQSEAQFAAGITRNEERLKSLSNSALNLRSSRQAALDARRLQAAERLWVAKHSLDRLRMAALFVSALNTEAMREKADDPNLCRFARELDAILGIDLTKETSPTSALTVAMHEQLFLPPNVWALFSAFKGVLLYAVAFLKVSAQGALKTMRKEDTLKPILILALPEYRDYIEKYGISGYYNLLPVLEQKMLQALIEALDGADNDQVTIVRSAEIWSAASKIDIDNLAVPNILRDVKLPAP